MFNIRLHSPFIVLLLLTVLACAPVMVRAQSNPIQASPADAFVDSIGTNVHLHWAGTLYYDNFPLVETRLQQLGIRHLRDGLVDTGWQGYYDHFNELGRLGIKTTFITSPGQGAALLSAYPTRMANAFEAYEAPNEYNASGDPNWISTLRSFQQTLFNTVKGNAATAGFPVIGPSLTSQAAYTALGNLSSFFDQGNMHDYLAGQNPGNAGFPPDGFGSILWNLLLTQSFSQSKPVITTETGYYTAPTVPNGVPVVVAGRYMPRLFLEQFNHGVGRTISYELADQHQNPSDIESNYGLLYYDGSPKPAFNALASLVQLLKDPGTSFKAGTLNVSFSGNTPDLHSFLLFQKRDGSFYLVLWVELPSYDVGTRQSLTVTPQLVTLSFHQPIGTPTVYSFDDNGIMTSASGNVVSNTLALSVSDRISVIALPPPPSTTAVTVASSPSGQTVTVDGAAIVAPQTFNWQASSSHTIGAASIQTGTGQRLTFTSWSDGGAATHQITVPSTSAAYTANFTASNSVTASATPANGGTITVTPGSADTYYAAGSQVQVTAAAAPGYRFYGFAGALTGTGLPQTITLSSPKSVVAGFACVYTLPSPSLTVSSKGGSGNLSISTGSGCIWSATSSTSWLQVATASGSGSGLIAYSVQANTTSSTRSAIITVGGQLATITQTGAAAVSLPTIRVNAGGPQFIDTTGKIWSTDSNFSGGATAGNISSIKSAAVQFIYQTERYSAGPLAYTFAVPNGNYLVTLKFAELYFSKPGQRVFSVTVNGQTVLQNLDLCALVGPLAVYDKQVAVAVTNGSINIQLQHVVENPKINAIEIVPAS